MKAEPNYEESLNLLSGEYTIQEDPVFYTQRNKGLRWSVVGICSSALTIIINLFLVISGVLFLVGNANPDFADKATPLAEACLFSGIISIALTVLANLSKRAAKKGDISGDLTFIVRGMAKIALFSLIIGAVFFLASFAVYNWSAISAAFTSLFNNMKAMFLA